MESVGRQRFLNLWAYGLPEQKFDNLWPFGLKMSFIPGTINRMTVDYKETVFLPKTNFPMRGNLTEKEPLILERWTQENLFERMESAREGATPFVLHDGPPYANGHLHIGHGFGKILKDVINRLKHMQGHQVRFIPGWDCHGLPIEWKIEEKHRAAGRNKDEIPLIQLRQECREFARHWVDIQRNECKRLGLFGRWDAPYTTMEPAAEAEIIAQLGHFLNNGSLYQGERPVLWSVVEKTALAEAEVEYREITSTAIYVAFPIVTTPNPIFQDARVVIWTTTPWTIPANRAIAYNPEISYSVIEIEQAPPHGCLAAGSRFVVASALVESFVQMHDITHHHVVAQVPGTDLEGVICAHPLTAHGYTFDVPLLPGAHVTTDTGTGLVHTAPGHGEDDFRVAQKHGIDIPRVVGGDGHYYAHVPLFAGEHVHKVAPQVCRVLQEAGALLSLADYVHSYPHSWRSHAPLIFRVTPQWFIAMDTSGLREKMLAEIECVSWYPAQSKRRIQAMVRDCPDWCISRQRAWGTPIALFIDKKTGQPLRDAAVMDRIVQAVAEEGSDVWFTADPQRFLGADYVASDYEQVQDILDVWFDSGCTQAFVLANNPDQTWPADLYVEGSDQHRGWFQSSLKVACGTRGVAPYKAVLTHGFALDEQGRKMSKSLGNTLAPAHIADTLGVEIMRLWVVSCDYAQDLRVGPEVLKRQQDVYRRLRNTLRYLMGGLADFQDAEKIDISEMPALERWVLHRVAALESHIQHCIASYALQELYTTLHNFCAVDLSAFYFDIRKDVLYCDAPDSLRRRALRTVFDILFERLSIWLAPVLCFTADEAWIARYGETRQSVHLAVFPQAPQDWTNEHVGKKYDSVINLRRLLTGALEKARAEGLIGASLQGALQIYDPEGIFASDVDWAETAIVSQVQISEQASPAEAFVLEGIPAGVVVSPAQGEKCVRCWQVLPEVGSFDSAGVCQRCHQVVA